MEDKPTPGITRPKLSLDPLATEGEATPGPDDVNPFDEIAAERQIEDFDPMNPMGQPPAMDDDLPFVAGGAEKPDREQPRGIGLPIFD